MPADFQHLLDLEPPGLLERLARVAAAIADCASELAEARGQELLDRSNGWNQSFESTVRGREKASQFNAVPSIQAKLETEARLDALKAEQSLILTLIAVRTGTGVLV